MTQRERTTGLPRARRRERGPQKGRFQGFGVGTGYGRLAILGGALALLLAVIGLFAYRIYEEQVLQPRKVILRVAGEEFKLDYYADRLGEFARGNSGVSAGLLEQSLFQKLEEEGLGNAVAREQGITVSDDDVKKEIALELGSDAGTPAYDRLLRARLKQTGYKLGTYERVTEAKLYNQRLTDKLRENVGEIGESILVRSVATNTREEADGVQVRVRNGENMGTIAQRESIDLTTRQQDGLLEAQPAGLFDPRIRDHIQNAEAGQLLAPLQLDDRWVVLRVENRDNQFKLSEEQRTKLARQELDKQVAAARDRIKVKRDLDSDDLEWALGQVN